jgi:WD40 repeat protein
VTFSFRPLYISELENALQSDFPDLTSVELSIISICGDFVQIEASKVGLIHDTARQFLQSSESSNVITKSPPQSHEYLASICLRYLSSRDMLWRQKLQRLETPEFLEIRRSRGTPLNNPSSAFSEDHPFLVYAAKHWAYHLSLADPDSPQLLALVLKFFRNACLPWINTLAYLNDLNTLIQSAQYIKTYIKHAERAESNGSTSGSQDSDTDELKLWAVDLIKIVGKFGSNLIQNPSSIYRYILPFCPTESITRKTYGSGRGGFAVTGISFREWDSCHARLSVGSDATATTVVATAEIFAALVPQAYSVIVWHAKTCEKLQHIHHGEYVTEVAVNKKGNIVCTAGAETLKIWEVRTGKELGRVQKEGNDRIIALSFGASDEEILVGSQDHLIVRCNWKTGASSAFRAIGPDPLPSQGLRVVSFSPDGTQVAVSSRKRPAELWDMATQSRTHRLTLNNEADHSKGDVFQAAEAIQWHPELGYLFLIYHNMTVVYWNPAYSEQTEHHNIKANMILCSPCGKLLLTSTYEGTVKVYAMPDYSRPQPEFSLLYHLECGESILDVAFSPSGQRFYELRESICSVWDPDELVPPEDVGTEDDPRPLNVVGWGKQLTKRNVSNKARVTAIASAPDNVGFCCGRDDGSLTIHDMEDGKKIRNLPGHSPDATIIALTWSSSGNWIASGDDSGHVVVRKVKMESKSNARTVVFKALDFRIRDGISQLLFSSDDKYLLVATSSTDRIWDVSAKVICQTRQRGSPRPVKWICHPTDKSRLISFDAGDVHIFEWNPFVDSNPERSLLLERIVKDSPGLQSRPDSIETIERIAQTKDSRNIILEVLPSGGQPGGHGHDHSKRRRIELVHAIDFTPDTDGNIVFQEIAPELARESSRLVGSYKNEIVFFNHQNWLCTWEIGSGVEGYKHHLPLPNDWTNKETLNSSVLNDHGTLLCPRNGEVAIIKNGLRL